MVNYLSSQKLWCYFAKKILKFFHRKSNPRFYQIKQNQHHVKRLENLSKWLVTRNDRSCWHIIKYNK